MKSLTGDICIRLFITIESFVVDISENKHPADYDTFQFEISDS